jgi:uncharacterized membrane protein (UPF0127 family)
MRLLNKTKKTILASDLKKVKDFSDNLLGLLKKSNPRTLLFITRGGIHTFFLSEAIDVIVLDNQNKVVKLGNNIKPWRIFVWNPHYSTVIELPKNTIKETKTSHGDSLVIED